MSYVHLETQPRTHFFIAQLLFRLVSTYNTRSYYEKKKKSAFVKYTLNQKKNSISTHTHTHAHAKCFSILSSFFVVVVKVK